MRERFECVLFILGGNLVAESNKTSFDCGHVSLSRVLLFATQEHNAVFSCRAKVNASPFDESCPVRSQIPDASDANSCSRAPMGFRSPSWTPETPLPGEKSAIAVLAKLQNKKLQGKRMLVLASL